MAMIIGPEACPGTCRSCGGSGTGFFGNVCGKCGGSGSEGSSSSETYSSDERKCSWGSEPDNT